MYKIANVYLNTKTNTYETSYFNYISKNSYTFEYDNSKATLFKTRAKAINALRDCGLEYWRYAFLEV